MGSNAHAFADKNHGRPPFAPFAVDHEHLLEPRVDAGSGTHLLVLVRKHDVVDAAQCRRRDRTRSSDNAADHAARCEKPMSQRLIAALDRQYRSPRSRRNQRAGIGAGTRSRRSPEPSTRVIGRCRRGVRDPFGREWPSPWKRASAARLALSGCDLGRDRPRCGATRVLRDVPRRSGQ